MGFLFLDFDGIFVLGWKCSSGIFIYPLSLKYCLSCDILTSDGIKSRYWTGFFLSSGIPSPGAI